jgi:hypothetical protein
VLDEENLHVMHNFVPIASWNKSDREAILTASYEGVGVLQFEDKAWKWRKIGAGNQTNLKSNRGASEIKMGSLGKNSPFIATIEPWHGNQVVVYTPGEDRLKMWNRTVIDEELRWGHAVWCADLDGDGIDELVIGVRDNPTATDKFTEKCGVRIYKHFSKDGTAKWERTILESGGVAVEDLMVTDFNGDGKLDIVAVGRATKNARIYWNQGAK